MGPFLAEASISLEKLDDLRHIAPAFQPLLPVMTALDDIPALAVTEEEAARPRRGQYVSMHGKAVAAPDGSLLPSPQTADRVVAVLGTSADATPVAIGKIEDQQFRPSRVFNLLDGDIDVDHSWDLGIG